MTTPAPPVYNARYELREQIGRGGTAQVYLARDLLLDRPVALKVLMSEFSRDHSFVERFRREAQAAANLTFPNIVSVYDWGESAETYFIVMEYVDGESLATIIRGQAPLDPAQAASIGADIANALSYSHRHDVVHRDVKPGNVLITADGQVKVTDFGIARAVGVDDQITQTGLVMGTATYFSPEQAQGIQVDGRSDIYSLGVVLYEMVVGRPPFYGDTPVSIAYQHVREEAPTPRSLNPSIPLALEAIILQAMAKNPDDRYQTAEELRADLGRFVHGQPVLARPPSGSTGEMTAAIASTSLLPSATQATTVVPSTLADAALVVPGSRAIEPARGATTTKWWASAGVLLLIAILLIVFFVGRDLGYFGGGTYIHVQYVKGEQRSHAESVLKAQGLQVAAHAKPGNGQNTGVVYDQDPAAGASVRKGATVTIDYYSPPGKALVPSVVNLQSSVAQTTLTKAGFVAVVKAVKAQTPTQKQGTVINQSPIAGKSLAKHSKVTIDVVTGSAFVQVPDVAGDTPTVAANVLGNALLTLGSSTSTAYSATVPAGNVISTSPPAGTAVKPGTTVTIKTSRGIGGSIPDVIGLTVPAAQQAISQAGMTGGTNQSCVTGAPASQNGLVISQSPVSTNGRLVPPTHVVTLNIGCSAGNSGTTGNSGVAGNSGTTTTTTTSPDSTPPPTP
jgi:eukaryotic-like serine/threonine-protein kinase